MRMSLTTWLIVGAVAVGGAMWIGRATRPTEAEAKNAADHERSRRAIARMVEKATPEIKRTLADPASARISKGHLVVVNLADGTGLWIVCGYVDAKDERGGYTGNRPWYIFTLSDGSSSVCVGQTATCKYPWLGEVHARLCLQSIEP